MNRKPNSFVGKMLVGGVLAGLLVAAGVQAAVVVDFNDYTTGQLAGQAGGAGLTGSWAGSVNNAIVAGNISAPAASAKLVYPQTGTAQKLDVTLGEFADTYTTISLASAIPTATEYWMSFLLNVGTPVSDRLFLAINPTGIGAFDGVYELQSNGSVFQVVGSATTAPLVDGDNFVVVRRTQSTIYGAGHSRIDFWINPASRSVFAGAGNGGDELIGYNGGISSIGIGGYSAASPFDNLRIGTSQLDVMLPEPSSALLLGFAGLLARRRRR